MKLRFPLEPVIIAGLLLEALSAAAQTPSPSISRRVKSKSPFIQIWAPGFDPDASQPVWFRDGRPGSILLELPPARNERELVLPPSPTPLPSASPLPSPTVVPTPTIAPTATPIPSPSIPPPPTPSESPTPPISLSPTPTPPLPSPTVSAVPSPSPTVPPLPPSPPPLPSPPPPPPVPPAPNPTPPLAPPVVPEIAPASGASGPPQWQTWQVEVWTNDSTTPQRPTRRGHRFELAYVTATEPALVRLQFQTVAAGKTVIVKPGPGVTVDPPQREIAIGVNGECVLSVSLAGSFRQSDITVYYVGNRITLPLARTSPAAVAATQTVTKGGR